jgi:hypothetical protein
LDGVRGHLIPHLTEKIIAKGMWDALTNLYKNKKEKRKISQRDNLHSTRMAKGESVASYITRFRQVKDELVAVGEIILDLELVCITLKGFTK